MVVPCCSTRNWPSDNSTTLKMPKKLRIDCELDCSNATCAPSKTNNTVAANGSGARQNSTQASSSPNTMRWKLDSVITALVFAHQTSTATPAAIIANRPMRATRFCGSASPGRHSTASAIRIGYSATQPNVCGATSAAAMPPIMPPADIQR